MNEKFFLATMGIALLSFGLISKRIEKYGITPPMAFVLLGIAIGSLGIFSFEYLNISMITFIAEMALILILFTDSSLILPKELLKNRLPLRLLLIGLPLTIFLGLYVAKWIFPSISYLEAAFLSILLAPTDLALGKGVVSSRLIPSRVREALHTESGLNDGLTLPFLFAAFAFSLFPDQNYFIAKWIAETLLQIIAGALAGWLVGWGSGFLVEASAKAHWMLPVYQRLTAVGLALFSYALAETFYGNGFIGTFTAGLTLRIRSESLRKKLISFGEAEGEQLALLIFLIFGGIFLPKSWAFWNVWTFVYALLSLTLVRMIPVALSMIGSKEKWQTIVFMGWFGPRGIATILFGLAVFQKAHLPHTNEILAVAFATVLVSIFIHGITARPGADLHFRLTKETA